MKKIVIYAIVSFFAGCLAASAAQIDESAARNTAARFMATHQMGAVAGARPAKAPRRNAAATTAEQSSAYYVFNTQQGDGYVIVSGDDRTIPVLGYGTNGAFDPNDVPENMQWWLEQYVTEIALLDSAPLDAQNSAAQTGSVIAKASSTAAIVPLTTSLWGQRAPFNFQCPSVDGVRCPTGCVATAMAQIMYYHKWPASTSKTIPEYTSSTKSINRPALSTTTFSWSSMKDYYESTETSTTATANAAVAKLMSYCAQAVKMNFNTGSSGANDYSEVFVEYFRFSPTARKAMRVDYTADEWKTMILTELEAKRPIIYGGLKADGGHSFICDGYDGNGYFHFNWGWYGSQNGYFALSTLNPENGGTGSIAGADGYTLEQDIIIGLQPNTVSTSALNSITQVNGQVSTDATSFTRASTSENFTVKTLTAKYWNPSPVERSYDLGWGLYNTSGKRLYIYNVEQNHTLASTYYTTLNSSLNMPKDLANGTYYLRPICRQYGNSTWYACHNSGREFFIVTINGTSLTLKTVSSQNTGNLTGLISSYGDVRKVGRPLEVRATLRNNSPINIMPVYLFANNKLVSANSVEINQNSSGMVALHYAPTESGNNTIKICSDASGNNIITSGSVTVSEPSAASLTVTDYSVAGTYTYTVTGKKISLTATFKNNLTTVYNDYVYAYLYKYKSGTSYSYVNQIAKPVYISTSSSKSITFDFDNLEPTKYLLVLYYYNTNTLTQALKTSPYTLINTIKGDVNGDGSVNGTDVTALYNYLLNNTKPAGDGDVNGDGSINGTDVTALYNIILGQ